ncbi:ABC transporter permease [Campylobacter sp. MG1]|uniref:ABC transporter permease n=1 Tax=Campylobacter sp. MG1 TaxID=2976332 RepID=UPI00226D1EFF|nr:ABC transporter permease [Campylobacter sp. MG1]
MKKYSSIIFWLCFLIIWQITKDFNILPQYIIPSPKEIFLAFIKNYSNLIFHTKITLIETFLGLFFGIIIACILAFVMNKFELIYKIIYPFFIVLQTIPTIAIAPILVLWLGYNMLPKIVLITITTIFPILINVLDGLKNIDKDYITLLKTMNANDRQILWHYKIPCTLPYFFSGLRVSVSYSYISAVVSEWLGGFEGLGVYMIQSKKLFMYDNMFAIIVLISTLSLISIKITKIIEKLICKWRE